MPTRDRGGTPYEVALELRRDDTHFGTVGERCGFFLADLASRLAEARADGSRWADPADRFPEGGAGVEPELFAFRYRDRGDPAGAGELRCAVRTSSWWVTGQPEPLRRGPRNVGAEAPRGSWRVARRAVVEAWGAGGRGVRAVLTAGELTRFVEEVLREAGPAIADPRDLRIGATSGQLRR